MSVADDFVRTRERGWPSRSSESPAASAARSLGEREQRSELGHAALRLESGRRARLAARSVWFSQRTGSSPSTRHT